MSKDHFVSVLRREYAALNASDRKQKIRELVSESRENEEFIRENLPKFFAESFAEGPVCCSQTDFSTLDFLLDKK